MAKLLPWQAFLRGHAAVGATSAHWKGSSLLLYSHSAPGTEEVSVVLPVGEPLSDAAVY